jgi:hypothetical protein
MQLQGKTLRQMMLVDVKAMIVHGRLNPDKLRGLATHAVTTEAPGPSSG